MCMLTDFKPNEIVTVIGYTGGLELQSRLVEMGFVPGVQIRIVKLAPWKGLVELKIRNYHVSIRMRDADNIKVSKYDG